MFKVLSHKKLSLSPILTVFIPVLWLNHYPLCGGFVVSLCKNHSEKRLIEVIFDGGCICWVTNPNANPVLISGPSEAI